MDCQNLIEYCCDTILSSTTRPTSEQRKSLMDKLTHEQLLNDISESTLLNDISESTLVLPPSPTQEMEIKPDTLMPNSCSSCGASFVDHGSLACSDEICYYIRREEIRQNVIQILAQVPIANPEQDNWVQCDTCNTWHKIESTEGLPDKWSCAAVGKACRAPKTAGRYWPFARAKHFVKHYYDGQHRRPSHMKCLELLASRKGLTVEELCNMNPANYIGVYNTKLCKQILGICYYRSDWMRPNY